MILGSISNLATAAYLHSIGARAILQLQSPQDQGSGRLMVIFMGIAAISLLVLALVVVGTLTALVIVGLKAEKALKKTVQEVKGRAYPLIEKSASLVTDLTPTIKSIAVKTDTLVTDLTPAIKAMTEKTHALIEELSPKLSGIADDLHGITSRALEITEFGKQKLEEFTPAITAARETFMQANATVRSATEKTGRQVERANSMVAEVLDWTNQVPARLEHTMGIPGRKFTKANERIKARGASLRSKGKSLWTSVITKLGVRRKPAPSPASSAKPGAETEAADIQAEETFAIG